jgi:hypothetical protein
VLERDRRTIRRALKAVPPDAYENGRPRWRLRKILEALDAHEQRMGHEQFGRAVLTGTRSLMKSSG